MPRAIVDPENALHHLVQPETILPAQFYSLLHRRCHWTAEMRLMAAILEDAVEVACTRPTTPNRRRAHREATRWLRSNDAAWSFSFLRICEALALDAGQVRQHTGIWPRTRVGRAAGPARLEAPEPTAVPTRAA